MNHWQQPELFAIEFSKRNRRIDAKRRITEWSMALGGLSMHSIAENRFAVRLELDVLGTCDGF